MTRKSGLIDLSNSNDELWNIVWKSRPSDSMKMNLVNTSGHPVSEYSANRYTTISEFDSADIETRNWSCLIDDPDMIYLEKSLSYSIFCVVLIFIFMGAGFVFNPVVGLFLAPILLASLGVVISNAMAFNSLCPPCEKQSVCSLFSKSNNSRHKAP